MKSQYCCIRYLWFLREHSELGKPLVKAHLRAVHGRWVTQVALWQGQGLQPFFEEEIMKCFSQKECYEGASSRSVFDTLRLRKCGRWVLVVDLKELCTLRP